MITTTDLIKAALARGLREKMPGEWFANRIVCPKCRQRSTVMTTWEGGAYWCRDCDGQTGHGKRVSQSHMPEAECYIGPDLTAPKNLYELLRFADAVGSGLCSLNPYLEVDGEWFFSAHIWRRGPVADVADSFNGYGPDRSTAVLAACAKALNIEEFTNANL